MLKFHKVVCGFLVLAGLLLGSCRAHAQETVCQETEHLTEMFQRGSYDEVISRTSALLDQAERPLPELLYLRGCAALRIAWFGAAERDLALLGTYRIGLQWPSASELLLQVQQMRSLCPAHSEVVRVDGKIAFRVYYDTEEDWAQAIIKLLPDASRIGKTLFNAKTYETAVFIFSSRQCLDRFENDLAIQKQPASWGWAKGNRGILFFSKTNGKGEQPGADTNSDYFRGTVVHEYTHSLVHRAVGTLHLPTWMDEGIAMYAAHLITPRDKAYNDQVMRRCVKDHTLLSLRELDTSESFYAHVEKQSAYKLNPEQPYDGPDAYAQALDMTSYLLPKDSQHDFCRFINAYCDSGDMETAFRSTFHRNLDSFYAAWRKHVTHAPGATTPATKSAASSEQE